MMAYYNDNNPACVDAIERRIEAGLLPPGTVDRRDISDVVPEDIDDSECHFFAGGGGWAYALRLAGWPRSWPVWTASPPCQPFSLAGKRKGIKDERHLAPVWLELVRKCLPPVIFIEQVASAVTKDNWLDDLLDALEALDYSTGAVVLPACSVGAPHIRQRLWVSCVRLADCNVEGLEGRGSLRECKHKFASRENGVADNPDAPNPHSPWERSAFVHCSDGRWRPIEPRVLPVVDGVPGRVELIREYGNAIVPQVAAEVIAATKEFINDTRRQGQITGKEVAQ